ncbi:MAG TPA: hypothetical protein VMT12_16875 [Syntrophales bacterium]|nr:hypothetical protein [Syntrophales bacterium]
MKKLKTYYTGLISSDWSFYPSSPYKGKGWTINFERTPTCEKFRGEIYYDHKKADIREVTICACSFNTAQNALEMINCATLLSTGEPLMFECGVAIPKDEKERSEIFSEDKFGPLPSSTCQTDGFPVSCKIAARASHQRAYKYALTKFGFASRLHSIFRVDIDPSCATEHLGVSPLTSNHVRYAYSIIAAYSTIEEIGLEIRASANNPSMIKGKWNPIVQNDLEQRLKMAGINPKETFPWDLRGKPTRIEKSKQLPSKGKCSWAKGPYVRDCELAMIDAINIASFLRSKISSHKMSEVVSSLTAYDVENVRMLARRLLLSRLGFWPPFKRGLEMRELLE